MSTHEYETPKNTTNNNNRRFSSNKKIPAPSPPTEGNVEFVKSKNYTHYKHTRHITEDEKIYETITTSSGPKTVNKSSTTYRTTEVNTTPPKEKDRQKRYFDNDVRLVNTEDKCDRATPDHKVHSMNRKETKTKESVHDFQQNFEPPPLNRSTANNSPALTGSNDSIYKTAASTLSEMEHLSVSNMSLNSLLNQRQLPNDNESVISVKRRSDPKFDAEFEKLLNMQSDLIQQFNFVDQLRKQHASKKLSASKTPEQARSRVLSPAPPVQKSVHIRREHSLPADPNHNSTPLSIKQFDQISMVSKNSNPPSIKELDRMSVVSKNSNSPIEHLDRISVISHKSNPTKNYNPLSIKEFDKVSMTSRNSTPPSIKQFDQISVASRNSIPPSIKEFDKVSIASRNSTPPSIKEFDKVSIASRNSTPPSIKEFEPTKHSGPPKIPRPATPSVKSIVQTFNHPVIEHQQSGYVNDEPTEYGSIYDQLRTSTVRHHAETLPNIIDDRDSNDYESIKSVYSMKNEPHAAVEALNRQKLPSNYDNASVKSKQSIGSKHHDNESVKSKQSIGNKHQVHEVIERPIDIDFYNPQRLSSVFDTESEKAHKVEVIGHSVQQNRMITSHHDADSEKSTGSKHHSTIEHPINPESPNYDAASIKSMKSVKSTGSKHRPANLELSNHETKSNASSTKSKHSGKNLPINVETTSYETKSNTSSTKSKQSNKNQPTVERPTNFEPASLRKLSSNYDAKSDKSSVKTTKSKDSNDNNKHQNIYDAVDQPLDPDSSYERIYQSPPSLRNEKMEQVKATNERPHVKPPPVPPPLPDLAALKITPATVNQRNYTIPRNIIVSSPQQFHSKPTSPQSHSSWDDVMADIRAMGQRRSLDETA